MKAVYRVDVYESERGWGRSHLESHNFASKDEAVEYAKSINSQNNLPHVPDYYVFAEKPRLVDLDEENPVAG